LHTPELDQVAWLEHPRLARQKPLAVDERPPRAIQISDGQSFGREFELGLPCCHPPGESLS